MQIWTSSSHTGTRSLKCTPLIQKVAENDHKHKNVIQISLNHKIIIQLIQKCYQIFLSYIEYIHTNKNHY